MALGGFSEDAEITLQLVGPQTYAEECQSYLGSCPTVDTAEHSAWLEEAKTLLLPSLEVLQQTDDSELKEVEQVRLRLVQPPCFLGAAAKVTGTPSCFLCLRHGNIW